MSLMIHREHLYFQTEDIITESVHVLVKVNCSDWIVLWVSFS